VKIFLFFSLLLNFVNFNAKTNRAGFEDFVKYASVLFIFSIIYALVINNTIYGIWLLKEVVVLIAIMFLSFFINFRIKFEILLIYLIFSINVLHLISGIFNVKVDFLYSIVELLRLPGMDNENVLYSNGAVGSLIYESTGIYLNRLSVFFDQPSTYSIIICLLSYVLLYENRSKFALSFILLGFLASPTKFGIMILPLFLLFFFIKRRASPYVHISYLIISSAVFLILIYPFIIAYVVDLFYYGEISLDYNSSFESRIYWSWLYGNGVFPWEVMEYNSGEVFAYYDGVAAKFSLLFSSIIAWVILPKIRYASLSMMLTVLLTMQYGAALTMSWVFFICLVFMKNAQNDFVKQMKIKKKIWIFSEP